MSLKHLLGLDEAAISDYEIIAKICEARRKNLDSVEFSIDGRVVRVSLPIMNSGV